MEQTEGGSLRAAVAEMMDKAWTEPGFCVPNQATYPHQWLWDSCFHALTWSALGSERGVTEVSAALANQGRDGFVPHMTYWTEPEAATPFWGRPNVSTITQPPMYGHAIAELLRAGQHIPAELMDRARRGLLHLGARPRTTNGLVPVFHPWETGCDDSARWDGWLSDDWASSNRAEGWRKRKREFVQALDLGAEGHAVGNPRFTVGSIGFSALVAWNARELAEVMPGDDELSAMAEDLAEAVAGRWSGDRWIDDDSPSGTARTLDSMLGLLADPRPEGFAELIDPTGYGAAFGPRGVHIDEPSYEPEVYWRGPAWPQLSYLMIMAALGAGEERVAETVAAALVAAAETSGLAEFWNPETGRGLGAIPQSWTGLAIVASTLKEGLHRGNEPLQVGEAVEQRE